MVFGRAVRASLLIVAVVGLGGSLSGCLVAPSRRSDLSARYPLDRARAVVAAAERHDADAIHALVNLLEDDDPGVRMYASLALERMCGETFGYRYYAPPEERAEALRRWRDALRNGEVVTLRAGSAQTPSRTGSAMLATEVTP